MKKYVISMIVLLIVIVILVLSGNELRIDNSVYNFLISFESELMTSVMLFITEFGGLFLLPIIALLSIIIFRKKWLAIIILLVDVLIANLLLKMLFSRERPVDIGIIEEIGFAFPSGHTMISTAFYGYIVYLLSKKIDKKYHTFLYSGLVVVLLLIGMSRIYLGVHYFTDVLAAYIFGLLYLLLFIFLVEKKGLISPK